MYSLENEGIVVLAQKQTTSESVSPVQFCADPQILPTS